MPRTFFDAHIHFFNIDDVPIYPTVKGILPVNSILVLGLCFRSLAVKALEQFKPFIQFFERSRSGNLSLSSADIWKCSAREGCQEVILTPLIMDFSTMSETVEKVTDQLQELLAAIKKAQPALLANNTKVLPFFGISLEHFTDCPDKAAVKNKILSLSDQKFNFAEAVTGDSTSGTLAGFKLYPSIKFDPCPSVGDPLRERYFNFYQLCVDHDIPITVHCQSLNSGAFKGPDGDKEELNGYLDPKNWAEVMSEFSTLRINFAHFGGDNVLRNSILSQQGYPKKPPTESWTLDIIRMLKQYPNTYTDISAYNFKNENCRNAFGVMIVLDENGYYDKLIGAAPEDLYKLSDKILWGSDWPMVIDDWAANEEPEDGDDQLLATSYQNLFDHFKESLKFQYLWEERIKKSHTYGDVADQMRVPNSADILEKIVSNNPKRFLFRG